MKLKYFLLLVITFSIFHLTFSIAEVRYVSHEGSSTPPYTTWETAADSIQKCIDYCVDGDTVIVANGTYYENLVIDKQLWLIGSSMDSTIINGSSLVEHTVVFNTNGSIKNFNIIGKSENVLTSRAVRSNTLNTLLVIKTCKISNAGVAVSMVGGDVIANNLYISNVTRGFNLFGENENYVSNCIILLDKENSKGINIGYSPNVEHHITNNIILFTNYPINSRSGISVGATREVYIYNNLISGFSSENIFLGQIIDTAYIKNNVLMYQYASGSAASIWTSGNIVFVNNVILSKNGRGIYQVGGGYVNSDYNIYWKNNVEDLYGLTYGDSDRVANPMFVKDIIPTTNNNYDYHLQAYSPGINAGDPNILDVDGTRSDIGMFGGPLGERYTYKDLAPHPPVNLTAVADTNEAFLKWNRNSEADTAYYNVYRDTTTNFTIDSTKLIASPVDTFFTDSNLPNSNLVVYKITAVDNQGNESGPSEEKVIELTSMTTNGPITINDYRLYQNYPNPFNPSTKIGYRLKEPGYVKLMFYDITGALVSVLVNKEQGAGYYEVEFRSQKTGDRRQLASGIYLYRIEVIGDGNIPVFSDMKKMLLIK